jgi:Cd2+/Zn2+-exporting ATPase
MTRQVEIPLAIPLEDVACGELLRQTLLDHRGVVSAAWNPVRQVLTLEYLPERISLGKVEEVAEAVGAKLGKRYERCTLRLAGMNCTECALSLERDLERVPGVPWLAVDFPGSVVRAEIEADGTRAQLERRIAELGFAPRVAMEKDAGASERRRMTILTAVCLGALATGSLLGFVSGVPWIAQVAFFVVAYAAGGYYSTKNAIAALRERTVDVNLLMVTAAVGAAGINHWQEGAILMFLWLPTSRWVTWWSSGPRNGSRWMAKSSWGGRGSMNLRSRANPCRSKRDRAIRCTRAPSISRES